MTEEPLCHLAKVEQLIAELQAEFDKINIIPRQNTLADVVLLGLLSKACTLFKAVASLERLGFPDEAFGLARSSIEIRFTVRFLTHEDSHRRSRQYFNFGAKINDYIRKFLAKNAPNCPLPDADLTSNDWQMSISRIISG